MNKLLRLNPSLVVVFFIFSFVWGAISILKIVTTQAPDFHVFYFASHDLLTHVNPYADKSLFTGFNYPPVTVLFYIPLLSFPLSVAQGFYVMLSFFLVFFVIFLSLKMAYKKFSWNLFFFFSALAQISFPVKFTLGMGQSNLIAYTFLLLSFVFYLKRKYAASSIFFAVAIFLKPVLVSLILLFLLRREWRVLLITGCTLSFLLFLSLFLFGTDVHVYYLQTFSHLFSSGNGVYYNQGLKGTLERLAPRDFQTMFYWLISFFALGVTSLVVIKRKFSFLHSASVFLTLLVLVDPLSWQHHFVFLILPFVYSVSQSKTIQDRSLLLFSYVLVSYNIKTPNHLLLVPLGQLLLSHVGIGAFLLSLFLLKLNAKKIWIALFLIWSVAIMITYVQTLLCRGGLCLR